MLPSIRGLSGENSCWKNNHDFCHTTTLDSGVCLKNSHFSISISIFREVSVNRPPRKFALNFLSGDDDAIASKVDGLVRNRSSRDHKVKKLSLKIILNICL